MYKNDIVLRRVGYQWAATKGRLLPVEGRVWISGPKVDMLKAAKIEIFAKENRYGKWWYLISLEDFNCRDVVIDEDRYNMTIRYAADHMHICIKCGGEYFIRTSDENQVPICPKCRGEQ